ncbi:MAG TPA: amino acid permease, partial [Victivallales bacterium]|nr:amino acid permease [Victivallales bacterium]
AAVLTSLRGIPLIAKEEMTMFVYLAFALIFFLIPASLVSAELGAAFSNRKGGIFIWVGEAFGKKWGFLAIWLQWVQNLVWYPTALAFAASAFAYAIGKSELSENHFYVGIFCIVTYWLATFLAFKGVNVFAKISNYAFIVGTVLPGIFLFILFIYWISSGHQPAWNNISSPALEHLGHPRLWPEIKGFGTISFLAGILLTFAGIEVQSVHVIEMKNPARDFPIAIALGALIALIISILVAIPIAAILPYEEINLTNGVFMTFKVVIDNIWHMPLLSKLLSFLVCFGVMGGIFAWIASPCRGLLVTAEEGELPDSLSKTNKNDMPTRIMTIQGMIVTLISCLYFVMDDVEVGFLLISAMTIALYLIMYMLMYLSLIKLRYSKPELIRPFSVPFGKVGAWTIAGIGFIAMLFSFIVSFFPPEQLPISSPALYTIIVIVSTIIFTSLPLIIHNIRKKNCE